MICGIEIALAMYGLLALFRGHIRLGNRVVDGAAAFWAGILFMLPWPLAFAVGFGIGFNEASAGRPFILKEWQGFLIALELVSLASCTLLGLLIVVAASEPQQRPQRRERMTEDYEQVLRNTGTGYGEQREPDRPAAPALDEPPYVTPAQPIEAIQPPSTPVPAGPSAAPPPQPPQPQSIVKPAGSTVWPVLVLVSAVIVVAALLVGALLLMPQQQNTAFNTIAASIGTTTNPPVVRRPEPVAPVEPPRDVPAAEVVAADPPGLWRQFPVPDRLGGMALTADGAWLAVADEEQRIQLWHTAGNKKGPEFPSGTKEKPRLSPPPIVAVSPDGRWVASTNPDGGVVLRELVTGDQKALLTTGEDAAASSVVALVFSPDSKRLAGATGHELHLWDIPDGAARRFGKGQLAHADTRYAHLQFTADGKQLFSSGVVAGNSRLQDGLDAFWDVATAQRVATTRLLLRQAHVPALITPDGGWWLARHGATVVQYENLRPRGAPRPSLHLTQLPSSWAFAPGISLLAVGHVDGMVSLWDAEKGEMLTKFASGSATPIQCVALAADGRILAAGTSDHVRLWEVAKLLNGRSLAGPQRPVEAPDPKPAAVIPAEPPAKIAERPPIRPVEPVRPPPVGEKTAGSRRICPLPQEDVSGIALSPGGKVLATTTKEHIILWDAATAKEIARFEDPCIYSIRTVAFSPDGKWLIHTTADVKSPVRVRDGATGQEVFQVDHGSFLSFRPIAVSPDSKTLALIGNPSVMLIDLATQARRPLQRGARINHMGATFMDDGKQLRLAGSASKGAKQGLDLVAQRVDVATGKELESLVVQSGNSVQQPIMAPNGRLFAFAYPGLARATLVDLEALDRVPALSGKPTSADAAAFTPDSRHLATFGRDGRVVLWDIEKSEAVQDWAFTMRQKRMAFLTVSPDSAALAVTTANGVMLCEVGKR